MVKAGEVLGARYRIERALGRGGMASVYEATDLRLDRRVALKVLTAAHAQEARLVERFEREARTLAAVHHPAIVSIFDVEAGDSSGREPYFVMELCPQGSLADRLAASGPLDPSEVVQLAKRVAEGLAALHERGIVHRDVKPHNILLADSGPKLADFGIAKDPAGGLGEGLTVTGTALGTLAYAAPETLAGEQPTGASDSYGLAAVVYEALTGRPPRRSNNFAQAAESLWATPQPASAVLPALGTTFDSVLLAALSPEPAGRPDPSRFAAELEAALEGRDVSHDAPTAVTPVLPGPAVPPLVAGRTVRAGEPASRRGGSAPAWLPVAAVALLAVLGALAIFLNSGNGGFPGGSIGPANSPRGGVVSTPPPTEPPPVEPEPATPVAPQPATPMASEPTTTVTPEPPPAAGQDVFAALDQARAVARQLDGDVREDLLDDIDEIEEALSDDGDDKPRDKARDLERRVRELIREGKLTGPEADQLEAAARAVARALRGR